MPDISSLRVGTPGPQCSRTSALPSVPFSLWPYRSNREDLVKTVVPLHTRTHTCHVFVPLLQQCTGRRGAHFLAVYSMAHGAGKPLARYQDHSCTSAKPPRFEPVAPMLTTLRVSPRAGPRQHPIRDSSRLFDCPTQYVRGHFTGWKIKRHTIPHALFGAQPFATASAVPVPPAGGTPPPTG